MRTILLAALLACGTFALTGAPAQAQQVQFPSPFLSGARADVNAAGQAAVAWAGVHGVRVATGDRAGGFGAPVALTTAVATAAPPQVAIDALGDVIVVWETVRVLPGGSCSTCGPRTLSDGVFAALRPAGGSFGAPVALAAPAPDTGGEYFTAAPRLAMSASGHAVIAWTTLAAGASAALRAPGGAIGAAQAIAGAGAGFSVRSAAISAAGDAFVGDGAGRVVVRPAGGAFAAPQLLPDAFALNGNPVLVAADSAGDALAAYGGTHSAIVVSRRPAGGDWGAPAAVPTLTGAGLRAAVLSDGGQGAATFAQVAGPSFGARTSVLAALSPAAGALVTEPVSPADLDADTAVDDTGLATDPAGDVAAALERYDVKDLLFGRRVAQVAVRRAGGAFGAPFTLTPATATHATPDTADVALDAAGDLLATWTDHFPGEVRLSARWLAPDGSTSVSVLDSAPLADFVLPPPAPEHGHHAQVDAPRTVTVSRRGRIAVGLRCVSNDGRACKGMLTLTVGSHSRRAGRAPFSVAAGHRRRISVGLDRRSLATLRRQHHLSLSATAVTTKPNGAAARNLGLVFAATRVPKGTLRVTERVATSGAVYTEGAKERVVVQRSAFPPTTISRTFDFGAIRLTRALPPGGYRINVATLICDGNCGHLDRPAFVCRRRVVVRSRAVLALQIISQVGRACSVHLVR